MIQRPAPGLSSHDQTGVALIEFALILPLLLLIAVGIVYYGYAFVIRKAIEDAAQTGIQEIVATSPLASNYGNDLLIARAKKVVAGSLAWLPATVTNGVSVEIAGECVAENEFGIHVLLPLTTASGGTMPQLSLGRFNIPPLPTTINSLACATI